MIRTKVFGSITAVAIAVTALTFNASSATASSVSPADSSCSKSKRGACFWSQKNYKGEKDSYSTVLNNCVHLDHFTAYSAWNVSNYKLTAYRSGDCDGTKKSVAKGKKIPNFRMGSFKLTH
ncbi:peptidase inhibitor family I36 protein [Streptomyces sp. NBC_01622]|uniref:peptidase inhibitor family I36 protein n=1 Tax=Streptomyces sp. NBC_01622 TaxID=2975903 RepID=UPI0038664DAD|nr:peptidase inhibitor family I36 protein [Streptomyces sp. NBC_01622]